MCHLIFPIKLGQNCYCCVKHTKVWPEERNLKYCFVNSQLAWENLIVFSLGSRKTLEYDEVYLGMALVLISEALDVELVFGRTIIFHWWPYVPSKLKAVAGKSCLFVRRHQKEGREVANHPLIATKWNL